MAKFKVGDYVLLRSLTQYGIIERVGKSHYFYKIYLIDDDSFVKNWDFPIKRLDSENDYYYKKIRKNGLSLELYKNQIEKEDEKFIWIRPNFIQT